MILFDNEFKIDDALGMNKDENPTLWRYMDIHKFMNFIESKSLFLTRLDKFEDPFEGISEENLLRHRISKYADNLDRSGGLKPVLQKTYVQQSAEAQKSKFVSCWFISERESVAMWKLYSNSDSVCVKVKYEELNGVLKTNGEALKKYNIHTLTYGKVVYKDFLKPESGKDNKEFNEGVKKEMLRKDVSFAHENEFRIIAEFHAKKIDENILGLPLDIKELFPNKIEVVCHPKMDEWKVANINSICKTHKLIVSRSELELK